MSGSETSPGGHPLGLRPSKIVAVHTNYRSRAEERGRAPAEPSYFLKPPSSLSADGVAVERPRGCELLCVEAELAVVIGRRARRVTPGQAAAHIGWYAAANDFGVYDLRHADRGSNLMAKGQDGFTPVGPRLVPAAELDVSGLRVRTLVNGEVLQDDTTAGMLFPPALLVADLSRFVTLEPGDIILTGTPANSRPVQPGDVVEVEIEGIGTLRTPVAEAAEPLAPIGAMPRVTGAERAVALGGAAPRPAVLSGAAEAALRRVGTATLTVQLRRHGIRDTCMRGPRPARPGRRLLGYAHTLRYGPLREDVAAADPPEGNAQRQAVESIGPGEVLVIEARGETGAGTIGDILATRVQQRGATGIVSDGPVRDFAAVAALDIPVYCAGAHAAVLGLHHVPLATNVPVACGGVLVMPGDVVVGDADGVVVLPAELAERVALEAVEQERREAFALERVRAGESTRGLFPLADERMAEYEAWRDAGGGEG